MENFPNNNTDARKEDGSFLGKATWVSREPITIGKEYFELQYEFAKILSEKTDYSLLKIIDICTPLLRTYIYIQNDSHTSMHLRNGVSENNVLQFAYHAYLQTAQSKKELMVYHPDDSTVYGCFSYDRDNMEQKKEIRIHFQNREFDIVGPLDISKIEQRKKEMADMFRDIRMNHPDVETVTGLSWLYNIQAYRRLFPETYFQHESVNENIFQWRRGTTIWGQFIHGDYTVKTDTTRELLTRLRALQEIKPLSQLYKSSTNNSPILPPLQEKGPIQDFYHMYAIE